MGVKRLKSIFCLQIPCGLVVSFAGLLVSCSYNEAPQRLIDLNSRYTEEQPALSGNGQFLAFISHRNRRRQILLYDLRQQRFVSLPGLNRPRTIVDHPSLSYTGRYISYLTSDNGRPVVAFYDRATQRSQVITAIYSGWVRNPHISPDGRYIVFESSSRGQWDIEILDRGPNVELDIPNGVEVNVSTGLP